MSIYSLLLDNFIFIKTITIELIYYAHIYQLLPDSFPFKALNKRSQCQHHSAHGHVISRASPSPNTERDESLFFPFIIKTFKSLRLEALRIFPQLGIPMYGPCIHHHNRASWYLVSTYDAVFRWCVRQQKWGWRIQTKGVINDTTDIS